MKKEKCILKSCDKESTTRGLCKECYMSARYYILSNKTTWEQLEKRGLAKSSGRKVSMSKFTLEFNK